MNRCAHVYSTAPFLVVDHGDRQAILEPFNYITANPGKEIRGKLIEAFNLWLKVPADKLQLIAKVVNMLHAASLM